MPATIAPTETPPSLLEQLTAPRAPSVTVPQPPSHLPPLPLRNTISQTHPRCNIPPLLCNKPSCNALSLPAILLSLFNSPPLSTQSKLVNVKIMSIQLHMLHPPRTTSNPSGKSPHNTLNYLLHNRPQPRPPLQHSNPHPPLTLSK